MGIFLKLNCAQQKKKKIQLRNIRQSECMFLPTKHAVRTTNLRIGTESAKKNICQDWSFMGVALRVLRTF